MALSEEEQAQLAALQAREQEATDDEEFDGEEIEVWNEKGAGARLRGKHSRAWLEENGFLKSRENAASPDSNSDSGTSGAGNKRQSKGPARAAAAPGSSAKTGTAGRYFGTGKH